MPSHSSSKDKICHHQTSRPHRPINPANFICTYKKKLIQISIRSLISVYCNQYRYAYYNLYSTSLPARLLSHHLCARVLRGQWCNENQVPLFLDRTTTFSNQYFGFFTNGTDHWLFRFYWHITPIMTSTDSGHLHNRLEGIKLFLRGRLLANPLVLSLRVLQFSSDIFLISSLIVRVALESFVYLSEDSQATFDH